MPKESTEKMYEAQISSYFKRSKFSPDDDFLKKYKEVIGEIEDFYPNLNTRKNMLNAIIIYGRTIDYPEKWLAYYGIEIDKLNQQIKAAISTNEKTEKQKENWISMDELKKVIESLKNEIPAQISNYAQYRSLMRYLAVYLQTHFPRRNDYASIKMVESAPKEKTDNYMVVPNRNRGGASSPVFIFNNYKTSSKFGSQTFPIPEDIYHELRFYKPHIQGHSPDGFLFIRKDGQPLNSNEFTKFFIATLQEKTGKKIGTSLMRHVIISEKFKPDPNELKERQQLAAAMGHSVSQQMQYAKS